MKTETLAKGVEFWRRNGYAHLRVHYTADPDKGEAWAREARKGYPSYSWRQEHEIDFSVTPGKPVYCDTERLVAAAQVYRPWLAVVRSWDFADWVMPAVVHLQVEANETARTGFKLRFLREVFWKNIALREFATKHVLPVADTDFPRAKFEDFGDVAGEYDRDKTGETSQEVLRTVEPAVYVRGRAMGKAESIDIFQQFISAGDVEVDPVGCPKLLEGLRGGYVRDDDGIPVKDGFYDHILDAARYGVGNLFRVRLAPGGKGKVIELARVDFAAATGRTAEKAAGLRRPGH